MESIRGELVAFATSIFTGMILRLAYQCLSCLRRVVRHRKIVVEIEDIVYWIAASIYLFVQIYYTSNGVLRWFFALGVVIGTVISTLFIRKTKKMSKKIYNIHSGKNVDK